MGGHCMASGSRDISESEPKGQNGREWGTWQKYKPSPACQAGPTAKQIHTETWPRRDTHDLPTPSRLGTELDSTSRVGF